MRMRRSAVRSKLPSIYILKNIPPCSPFVVSRRLLREGGGKMADSGSVLFNFERRGIIVVDCDEDKEEEIFETAIEAGADDVEPRQDGEDGFVVSTEVSAFMATQRALADAGFAISDESALKLVPLATVDVDDETAELNDALIEKLLELDDVDAVYTQ